MFKNETALLNVEEYRGLITSLVSGIFSQSLIYLTGKTEIEHKQTIIYVITFVLANILSFMMDILFAKDKFDGKIIHITDFKFRLDYLMKKIISYQIIKFFIVVVIDVIIVDTIYRRLIVIMDRNKLDFKYRNELILFSLTTLSFTIYVNTLRFKWVYCDNTGLNTNLIVLMWATVLIVFKLGVFENC